MWKVKNWADFGYLLGRMTWKEERFFKSMQAVRYERKREREGEILPPLLILDRAVNQGKRRRRQRNWRLIRTNKKCSKPPHSASSHGREKLANNHHHHHHHPLPITHLPIIQYPISNIPGSFSWVQSDSYKKVKKDQTPMSGVSHTNARDPPSLS